MKSPGVLKKEHVGWIPGCNIIPGCNKKEVKFLGGFKENSCGISMGLGFWHWNFQGASVTTILQDFQGWKFVFSGILGKVTNLKIPEGIFRKVFFPVLKGTFLWTLLWRAPSNNRMLIRSRVRPVYCYNFCYPQIYIHKKVSTDAINNSLGGYHKIVWIESF